MKLYHGSNVEITTVDYKECREVADFGRGFYTTNIKEQAIEWAKRMAIEHMGSEYNPEIKAIVTVFDFDTSIFKDSKIKYISFRGPSASWKSFVKNNTKGNKLKGNHNLNLQYDLVSGYVASPELYTIFDSYESGMIDRAIFKACLKAVKKTNQYSFHTRKSLKYLKSPKHQYFDVTKEEFDNFHISRNSIKITLFDFNENNHLYQRKLNVNLDNILPLKN